MSIFDIPASRPITPTPQAPQRPKLDLSEYSFVCTPFQHQITALERSQGFKEYAYLMEMGTGKSKVIIDDFSWWYSKGKIDAIIIWANKGCYKNWVNAEIPIHLPKHIPYQMTYWDSAASTTLQQSYVKLMQPFNGLKILVMNVEALAYEKATKFAKLFCKAHRVYAVVDESTSIKNWKAKRTVSAIEVGQLCLYRRIATGSPVTNNPLDLFSQAAFLGYHLLGFSSFYAFRARYAEMVQITIDARASSTGKEKKFKKVKCFQHLDELTRKLQSWSYRCLKKDCLDLPEKIYEYREVELTPEQKRAYLTMRTAAFAELDGSIATVMLALTKILRLHQIVCGNLKDDDGVNHALPNNRIPVLLDTIDEGSGKFIIYATYIEDIQAIQKALAEEYDPRNVVTYYGATSKDDRDLAVKRFQEDPECRFFVANRTGAYGLTLTTAETVIYYSNDYNLEVRLQSEDRAHRIGQKNNVTYIDLICRGTVDEKIIKALRDKKTIADLVTGDGWKEWIAG
jgi:SNF2 family DNA or RNA helicase